MVLICFVQGRRTLVAANTRRWLQTEADTSLASNLYETFPDDTPFRSPPSPGNAIKDQAVAEDYHVIKRQSEL